MRKIDVSSHDRRRVKSPIPTQIFCDLKVPVLVAPGVVGALPKVGCGIWESMGRAELRPTTLTVGGFPGNAMGTEVIGSY